ncbi:NEL domain-containing protein [Ralstonia pseudosolanacearum]|uniref:Type III effector protein n=1 Tax=Ralstonia solanacearum TaxID=305 RepID=A0AA92EHF6_RALSL|nr:NEL domain-containing protein [Ralstonia pseudosolanacearum]QCX51837.1 type III effector protein [Ralstonia pseudosolanacearum]
MDAHRPPPQANPATNRPRGRLAGNLQRDNGNPLITSLNVTLGEAAEADVAASYAGHRLRDYLAMPPSGGIASAINNLLREAGPALDPYRGSAQPATIASAINSLSRFPGPALDPYRGSAQLATIASAINNLSRFPGPALDPYRGSAQPATQVLEDWAARCRLPAETVDAWRPALDQEESRPFVSLLARLAGCASFKPEHRAESLKELGGILQLAAHNDAYRARCFDICGGADANCHDNVDVIFGNLRLAARDPSYHRNAQLHEVLSYHNDCIPWTLIDDFVSQQFKRGDQLERVLALRMRLSDILPITTPDMLHGGVAGITDAHEREARTYIGAHLGTQENLLRNLSRSPAWRQFLERQRPVEFAANTLLWESALQDLMAKPAGDGAVADALPAGSTAAPASRTEALAQARAMPGIGTGQAFQHRQANATVMLAEAMTRQLVTESAPPPDETGAHAALLTDPDWLAYLQKEHPEDPAFSSADMDAGERHDQLMRLSRQEIADARGVAQAPAAAPTDHG